MSQVRTHAFKTTDVRLVAHEQGFNDRIETETTFVKGRLHIFARPGI